MIAWRGFSYSIIAHATASSLNLITASANSMAAHQDTGTPICVERDRVGHRYRFRGQVLPGHPRSRAAHECVVHTLLLLQTITRCPTVVANIQYTINPGKIAIEITVSRQHLGEAERDFAM